MSNDSFIYDCAIFALRKFTGGMGDEDDCQPQNNNSWMNFFLQTPEKADKIVCTQKANGEAAHLSVRFIGQQFYLFVGSKNVHIIVSTYSDIEKYSDGRFQYAKVVAEGVLSMLSAMNEESLQLLFNFLHFTKLTAVFELLQPNCQHIVNLSSIEINTLKFITWTLPYGEVKENIESYCAVSPEIGLEFAQKLGFETVGYDIIHSKDVPKRMEDIRQAHGIEGEVMYFVDNSNSVFGLIKKKTDWYIVLRAIREKAVSAFADWQKCGTFQQSAWSSKVKSRLKDIQKWVGFSDKFRDTWAKLGSQIIGWIIHLSQGKLKKNAENNRIKHIINEVGLRPQFPLVWKQFLADQDLNDKISW